MILRTYRPCDCKELADLFYHTVHIVNAADYTEEQLNAWATGTIDFEEWNRSLLEHYSIIALDGKRITGFGYIDKTGYLDSKKEATASSANSRESFSRIL